MSNDIHSDINSKINTETSFKNNIKNDLRQLVIFRIKSHNGNYFRKKDFCKFWKFLKEPNVGRIKYVLVYPDRYDYLYKYFFEYSEQLYYTFSFNDNNVNYDVNNVICSSFVLNDYLIYVERVNIYEQYYVYLNDKFERVYDIQIDEKIKNRMDAYQLIEKL